MKWAWVTLIVILTLPLWAGEPGLVLHLSFEGLHELEGKAVLEGNPVYSAGPVGQAVSFDGEDDRLLFLPEIVNLLASLHRGTIAFWFKFENVLSSKEILPLFYVGVSREDAVDDLFVIEIGHRDPKNLKLYVTWVEGGRIPLCFDTGRNLEPQRWYHFALVVSDQGNTGYLNGVELFRRHYNFGSPRMQRFLADVRYPEIGALGYGKTARGKSPSFLYLNGALDEFRIYARPLTPAEILDLYKEGQSNLRAEKSGS